MRATADKWRIKVINIDIIPSKSYAHRALICAALADKKTRVVCELTSDDITATRSCISAMTEGTETMECGESGSTLRFMLPVLAAQGKKGRFITKGRLAERPIEALRRELIAHGCRVSPEGESPVTVEGQLTSGKFALPGNISSQFVTGLLLALPLLAGDSTVVIDGELESSAYVDITLDVLKKFGIDIEYDGCEFFVKGGQKFCGPLEYFVEGDWSAAAYWLVLGAIGREAVSVGGLNMDSKQGDRGIVEVLRAFGAEIEIKDSRIIAYPSSLKGTVVDVSGIPDLTPAIALAASVAEGRTEIINADRLRLKESDRLTAISNTLNSLGGQITELRGGLIIDGNGGARLKGGSVNSYGDHRIVMMAAAASVVSEKTVEIEGREAVNKSYPGFFTELLKWR